MLKAMMKLMNKNKMKISKDHKTYKIKSKNPKTSNKIIKMKRTQKKRI